MGHPVSRREAIGLRDPYAPAVDPPTSRADDDRPLLAQKPDPEPPPLERQAGAAQQIPLVVTDEVSEQAERHPLGAVPGPSAALPAPDRDDRAPAPPRLEHRDQPPVREAQQRGGKRKRPQVEEQHSRSDERERD